VFAPRLQHTDVDHAELIARVLAGERELFGHLLAAHYSGLLAFCRGHGADAEDLAQEVALQAF
jgi:DNA-directed RNA polymerase specialized sigma24 family protein